MDMVRLASPWVLLMALPAWGIIIYAAFGGPAFTRRAREAGSVFRSARRGALGRALLACAVAAMLVAALAGPSIRISRRGLAPVCMVEDVSASMKGPGPASASEALVRWARALPRGRVGLVQFAGGARVAVEPFSPQAGDLAGPDAARVFAKPPAALGLDETDLAAGLDAAAMALPEGQGVILLYTDARETRAGAVAAATRLASRGIPVFAAVPVLSPRHARIAGIAPALEPVAGRRVAIEVQVASTVAAEVQVRLQRQPFEDQAGAKWDRAVTVGPDATATLLFEDAGLPDGVYFYEAEVRLPDDAYPEHCRGRAAVRVGTPRRVLYVFGAKGPGPLATILRQHLPPGIHFSGKPLGVVTPAALADASVVILDNIPAWSLGEEMAGVVARCVTEGGMGLLALGGDASFAAGGYADSPLDAVLPVTSRTGQRPPIAMVLVVDSSGSMNEKVGEVAKLALAKQAILAVRPALSGGDRLGIIAFAGQPREVSPLVPLSQWEDLKAKLLAIVGGGGTRITPAVQAGLDLFSQRAADDKTVRHLLLLSDGRSEDFDIERLVAAAGARGVTISVVATGPDADAERLRRLAAGAAGRLYATGDLGQLAETFLEDLAWARGDGLRDESRPALWRRPEPIWRQASSPLPPVPAWNATRAKEGADVEWEAAPKTGEPAAPLLASWQRGLGRAAAMPWPVARASGEWVSAGRLGRDMATVMAWLSATPVPVDWSARLVDREGVWWVRVEERGRAIGVSAVPFVASPLAGPSAGVVLPQVAPGIYEAATAARSGGAAVFAVHRQDDSGGVVYVTVPGLAPLEFDRLGVDRPHLEEIVRAGGGQILASPQALADIVHERRLRGYEPIGPYFVWAAGAVVALMVVLRLTGRL
jgi:Mg-chelatase subunit ChlD